MGNWRRVKITGECDKADVRTLKMLLATDFGEIDWTCLCNGGLAGLPNWADERINALGNLGERDYSADSVAEALNTYLESVPSLDVVVHVGGEHEIADCEATVKLEDGEYRVFPAELAEIEEISENQMKNQFFDHLFK